MELGEAQNYADSWHSVRSDYGNYGEIGKTKLARKVMMKRCDDDSNGERTAGDGSVRCAGA